MSFTAFEVSLNGERLYTVGSEDWRQLWCNVLAHRTLPELLPPAAEQDCADLPDDPIIGMFLSTMLSVPIDGRRQPKSEPDAQTESFRNGTFPRTMLKQGDVVQIKIIETGSADDPEWEETDGQGPRIVSAQPDPDAG